MANEQRNREEKGGQNQQGQGQDPRSQADQGGQREYDKIRREQNEKGGQHRDDDKARREQAKPDRASGQQGRKP